MAVLWQKVVNGSRYEVRAAGNSRRLYTNGVFHSQYNPRHPLTGGVWDLLMLPAFLLPAGAVRRVLVLGVGGGTVIQQLIHFVKPDVITGIEWDPVHLYVAKRFFGLPPKRVVLHQADAVAWLRRYRGPGFDLIIDDLFIGQNGDPAKAVTANAAWFHTLLRNLRTGGALVSNFVSFRALRDCAYFTHRSIERRFPAAFALRTEYAENAIGAFLRRPGSSALLRTRLQTTPGLDPRLKTGRLRYRIRRLNSDQ